MSVIFLSCHCLKLREIKLLSILRCEPLRDLTVFSIEYCGTFVFTSGLLVLFEVFGDSYRTIKDFTAVFYSFFIYFSFMYLMKWFSLATS